MFTTVLLPPLGQLLEPLNAQTQVWRSSDQSKPTTSPAPEWTAMPLAAAMQGVRKASDLRVLVHPQDAPALRLAIPPLVNSRREQALRVQLEDHVLSDVRDLQLLSITHGKSSGQLIFDVAYVERRLLTGVHAALSALGQGAASLAPLSLCLPIDTRCNWQGAQLWRDAQGAGALPLAGTEIAANLPKLLALNTSFALSNADSQASGGAAKVFWARWRYCVWAAAACMAVYTAGTAWEWRRLAALESQYQLRIASAFAKALPNTPMIDPLLQLQRAAQANAAPISTGSALGLALLHVPTDWPEGAVQALDWDGKALVLTVDAKTVGADSAKQTALAEQLGAKGLKLRWLSPASTLKTNTP